MFGDSIINWAYVPFAKCPKGPEIRNDENHFVIKNRYWFDHTLFCTYVTLLYDITLHNSTLSVECVAYNVCDSIPFTLVCQSYTKYLQI